MVVTAETGIPISSPLSLFACFKNSSSSFCPHPIITAYVSVFSKEVDFGVENSVTD